jgi:hypothetical protein
MNASVSARDPVGDASTLAMIASDRLADTSIELTERAAAVAWRGPDAYDGLWWHWPAPLVGGRLRRQAIMQLHVRSPVDIRRIYRRSHPLVPKALGLFGSAGLRIHRLTGNDRPRQLAINALEVLHADQQAGRFAWGYHWDMQTRWSFYPAGSPSIVHTAFAVSALLEAERDSGRTDLGERARDAARWVLDALWLEREGFFAYHPHSQANIHNANMLGAWLVWAALGEQVRDPVLRAIERTIDDQRSDGCWAYGEGQGNLGWADSFHTGYVLACLDRLRVLDPGIDDAVSRGARFYLRFFGPKGEARLWPDRRFPEDAHSAGTGLTTLALLVRRGLVERELLTRVAGRVLAAGIRDGHAVFRRYRWGLRSSVHYLRWCDAHVALGLADAAVVLAGGDDPAPTYEPQDRAVGRS